MTQKPKNSLPKLLDRARPSLNDFAAWTGMSRSTLNFWREGRMLPQAGQRRALVKAIRKHAQVMLDLADAVEAEGKARDTARTAQRQRRAST